MALTRLSQLNLLVFLAVFERHIEPDDRLLVLSGVVGSQRLDTLVIVKPARDFPWLKRHTFKASISRHVARTLEIALRLAREGREGTPIGTIFVLGDAASLAPHLRQLILNPVKGHRQDTRSIHHSEFLETIRELAALDGAFIIDERGVVGSAGTYLDASLRGRRLNPGLGARHAAALSITSVSDAIAVVVSASSGTVTVYEGGETVLELERAQASS
jgi:DNA integrity scanning protein DisA with diadenylate cyclase activity